jgi:quinolinate synthase
MDYLARGVIDGRGTHILSTEGMIAHVNRSPASRFVVATEIGVLHRMRKANPTKQFVPIDESISCRYMKLITLEKVRNSLRDLREQVTVPPEIANRARLAIDRMLAL